MENYMYFILKFHVHCPRMGEKYLADLVLKRNVLCAKIPPL
jgi:hypothetical protein